MGLTSQELIEYIKNDLQVDTSDLDGSSVLFSSGIIDSFALVSLICFIESSCGFQVDPADVTLDNMDTMDRILSFADHMMNQSATSPNHD